MSPRGRVCHLSPELVDDGRKLLLAASDAIETLRRAAPPGPLSPRATIGPWPTRTPTIEQSVRRFLPTVVLLNSAFRRSRVALSYNDDHTDRFLVSLYLVESVRETREGRLREIAVRNLLAPPARPEEAEERARHLAELAKGVPLTLAAGTEPFRLTGLLTRAERVRARGLALHDQIALSTVLAAPRGAVAVFSPSGRWPANEFVHAVASRLACRVHRFSYAGVPLPVVHGLRFSRYDA